VSRGPARLHLSSQAQTLSPARPLVSRPHVSRGPEGRRTRTQITMYSVANCNTARHPAVSMAGSEGLATQLQYQFEYHGSAHKSYPAGYAIAVAAHAHKSCRVARKVAAHAHKSQCIRELEYHIGTNSPGMQQRWMQEARVPAACVTWPGRSPHTHTNHNVFVQIRIPW
jgi:hypothetical protein